MYLAVSGRSLPGLEIVPVAGGILVAYQRDTDGKSYGYMNENNVFLPRLHETVRRQEVVVVETAFRQLVHESNPGVVVIMRRHTGDRSCSVNMWRHRCGWCTDF